MNGNAFKRSGGVVTANKKYQEQRRPGKEGTGTRKIFGATKPRKVHREVRKALGKESKKAVRPNENAIEKLEEKF